MMEPAGAPGLASGSLARAPGRVPSGRRAQSARDSSCILFPLSASGSEVASAKTYVDTERQVEQHQQASISASKKEFRQQQFLQDLNFYNWLVRRQTRSSNFSLISSPYTGRSSGIYF